jgi:hypothetical protein
MLYKTKVATIQEATRDWQRQATSPPPRVIPIGTLPFNEPGVTLSPTPIVTATISLVTIPLVSRSISIVIVSSASPITTSVFSENIEEESNQPFSEGIDISSSITPSIILPLYLEDTEDLITESALATQLEQDTNDVSLSISSLRIGYDGIRITGTITNLPEQTHSLVAFGSFSIDNYSLVVQLSSILIDGLDASSSYRTQVESRINSSLYRLLPQRYVQSYELDEGEIRVFSKVRP